MTFSHETMVYKRKEITEDAVALWFDGFEILGTKKQAFIHKILHAKEYNQNIYREHKMVKLENVVKLMDYSIIVKRESDNDFEVTIVKVSYNLHLTNNSYPQPSVN